MFDGYKFLSKTIIAISVLASPCRTVTLQLCSMLEMVVLQQLFLLFQLKGISLNPNEPHQHIYRGEKLIKEAEG